MLYSDSSIADQPTDLCQTLELIAQHGNAKEVLLVVQESIDSLLQSTRSRDDNNEGSLLTNPAHVVWKWINLINMYTLAFPRIVLRKRSATDTAGPIIKHLCKSFDELQEYVHPNGAQASTIVDSCMGLGYALLRWFDATHTEPNLVAEFKALLQDLLFLSVAICLDDEFVLEQNSAFVDRLSAAGSDFRPPSLLEPVQVTTEFRMGEYIVFTLSERGKENSVQVNKALQAYQLGISLCLRQYKWRQLAIRWLTEHVGMIPDEEYLDGDIATYIAPSVSLVAATDSRPAIRSSAFRLLSQTLHKVHSEVAFGLVRQLVDEECPYSNMRSSAVGLLRQLVVRAFSRKPQSTEDDPFAARILLQEYADILFASSLLDDTLESVEAVDPQEMNRIIESLGFYYVVLARDKDNSTGVRDAASVEKIDREFISLLNRRLPEWQSTSDNEDIQSALRLISFQLERVEEMIKSLKNP
ncbi:YAP/Alf4/glomulin family protein [Ceratobasidium sp. AG-Ba]|nr:YAP/Alf4/glomulin family protein [Ceratobasidium sp. AG-Ba]QRW10999.1 YAP/Alf4/glomulin family protein [Ceratobasidium sp. AG-Ba]